ncbi:MAG: hypothetical protein AAF974_06465 [Cyanobacteria bacterium P01_E01_bin.34]
MTTQLTYRGLPVNFSAYTRVETTESARFFGRTTTLNRSVKPTSLPANLQFFGRKAVLS